MTVAARTLSNHKIEEHYFERFRKVYTLPPGVICYGDKPDVWIKGCRTIGVEITRFFLQSGSIRESEQVQRQYRDDVVTAAHKRYLASSGKGIDLTIEFDPLKPIKRELKMALAKKIAAFAASVHTQSIGCFYSDSFPAMPQIKSIWLNSKDWPDPKWHSRQVYTVEEMSSVRLQEIVAEKESKVAQYATCDAYWLLIVVDWTDPAQEQEITTSGFTISSTVFEKIIVYKPSFEEIVEVLL